jgi:hypothetical protein
LGGVKGGSHEYILHNGDVDKYVSSEFYNEWANQNNATYKGKLEGD